MGGGEPIYVEMAGGAIMKGSSAKASRFIGQLFALASIVSVAAGCASIIKGSDQSMSFKSDPSEARLVITDLREGKDIHVGTTPATTSLKRGAGYFSKSKYKVTVEKRGYRKEEIVVEGSPNAWYILGNLVFGGLIGWLIVDPATGAMWTLDPEDVSVTLKKEGAFRPQDDSPTIVLRSMVPAELEPKMKLLRAPFAD